MSAQIAREGSVAWSLLNQYQDQMMAIPGVVGVGLGVPVREKDGEIHGSTNWGEGLHWTRMALKVLVERKRGNPKKEHRIPREVTLDVSGRLYRFPVDVSTLAGFSVKEITLQAGADPPLANLASPGFRCLLGVPSPNAPSGRRAGQPGRWQVGTVAAIVGSAAQPRILTAGHVAANIYAGQAFPAGPGASVAVGSLGDTWTRVLSNPQLTPSQATANGVTTDVVAVPLPPNGAVPFAPSAQGRNLRALDDLDLLALRNRRAQLVVERSGARVALEGVVEAVFSFVVENLPNDSGAFVRVRTAPVVAFRFLNQGSVPGDSGAPLTAMLGNNQIGILGVHFAHVQLHNPRSLSLCTTISAALRKVELPLV